MVVPVLKELELHLKKMSILTGISIVAKSLLKELERRFLYVLEPTNPSFDGFYVAATLLNPAYRKILTST
uniref:Uncharacterized protein n=1 Tax=Amphimedon queenslandica TaxID=400682 RepID=A0A1X7TKH5_AMPQE